MEKRKFDFARSDWFCVALLGLIVIVFCNRLLFTDQIIRASDVITQYFWGARAIKEQSLLSFIKTIPDIFQASWGPLSDGGRTLEGGWNANYLLFYERLIQHYFPFPSSIAWLAVLSLLWGGIGTFFYCRLIGIGRFGSLVAGLLFALCTENASLINAGHIQKIETISWLPWVFFYLEKALRSGRFYHYAMTSMMLALQFFNMHWQISFYSCLAVGAYWIFFAGNNFLTRKKAYARAFRKDILLIVVMVTLFFSAIAMSFAPLLSWSRQSERGGGMSQEEGMSWSMPPEEIATFFAPGLFGYSRQEAGDLPAPGQTFYWGRMQMSQTNDYLGLLPWFLVPLPLLFRRDRYTWFFSFLILSALIMALGKYTFIYQFMFDQLPGFSKFRVPKMILFLFAFSAAVLTGKGVDCLEGMGADRKGFGRWLAATAVFVSLLGVLWIALTIGKESVLSLTAGWIYQPTRYQSYPGLALERYGNMLREAGIAFGVGCLYLSILFAWFRRWLTWRFVLLALIIVFVADLWRVNDNFFVLTHPPETNKTKSKNEVVRFLEGRIGNYRMQPLNEENSHYYSDFGLANISAYVTISEKRYKEFLDSFSLMSRMPDMMNLKYLIMPLGEFEAQQRGLGTKYTPVFVSSEGSVVAENRNVLPKAWLVSKVAVVTDPAERLGIMSSSPEFDPARIALVEAPPLLPMPAESSGAPAGTADVERYEPNRISVKASTAVNSLLVLGEKYYRWWYATVDGKPAEIVPVNHILRGVYLPPGQHSVDFRFDPLPFKVGKYLTLGSFALFFVLLIREACVRRRN